MCMRTCFDCMSNFPSDHSSLISTVIPEQGQPGWPRLVPQERKIRGSIPTCAMSILPGRVILVT